MNEQAASLAALNVSLLEAIKAGNAGTLTELAERAGIAVNNINRKLNSLSEAGLIDLPPAAHQSRLTEDGARALANMTALLNGEITGDGLTYIPFDRIDGWLLNPRTQFDDASIEDMAQSVTDKGVLQPLTVRAKPDGRFEVIIGERRRRGCTRAVERGWVAADFLVPCQVKSYSDDEALDIAGVENLQRQDLHWMDEAKFYLRLAERGRSGAEIARLAGESVSKRKVQDYCKIARELSPKDIERCYLPETAEGVLLYSKARDLVGDKKEKAALELSPQLAVALAELLDAGAFDTRTGALIAELYSAPVGGPLGKLQERKLVTFGFGDRKQLEARIPMTDEIRDWIRHTGLTPPEPNSTRLDPDGLARLRESALGPMIARGIAEGRYHTAELNAPTQNVDPLTPTQRRVLREIAARSFHRSRLPDDFVRAHDAALSDDAYVSLYDLELVLHRRDPDGLRVALTRTGVQYLKTYDAMPGAKSANSCTTPWLRDDAPLEVEGVLAERADAPDLGEVIGGFMDDDQSDEVQGHTQPDHDLAREAYEGEPQAELPSYLQRLAGVPATAPDAAAAPLPAVEDLPAMLAIVMIEAAHKIGVEGIERGPETWAAPILADFYKDSRGQQLVMKRFLAFMPLGERQLVTVAKAGREWLEQAHGIMSEGGKPSVTLLTLSELQGSLVGHTSGRDYSTPWLNKPAAETAPEPAPAAPEADGDAIAAPSHERGEADCETASASPSADPHKLEAQERALLASYGLLGQLDELIAKLRAKATEAHKTEIDQYRRLIDAVRETARANLPDGLV